MSTEPTYMNNTSIFILTDVDFDIQTSFIFDVTEDMFTISIEVIEDIVPEKLERFTVSIANITTVEESSGAIIRVGDVGSIEFAIYDNDCK